MCFVDLRKAYDTVPRLQLLETFRHELGIDPSIVSALAKLYTNITARVVLGNELSDSFQLNEGVR